MLTLGIESSCDETAAALVNDDGLIVAEVVRSQISTHAPYGGVVPEIASRAHLDAIRPVVEAVLKKSNCTIDDVGLIAATNGPGLVGSLLVGFQFAKTLSFAHGIPLVGVDHLHGHLHAARLRRKPDDEIAIYPHVALIASGGHTALYFVPDEINYELLGQTRDDAAGECFDKCAKLLGLGYPGGPVIDRLAAQGNAKNVIFNPPMPAAKDPNFSFSGLKTAMARHVEKSPPKNDEELADICAGFQLAVATVLVRKLIFSAGEAKVNSIVLGGGVAANSGLRAEAAKRAKIAGLNLFVPPRASCTDNAAMIALSGIAHYKNESRMADHRATVYSRDPNRRRGKYRADGSHIKNESKN